MTVDELFQLVESNSKTLQEQKISVEFAQKGIEAARTARLPELGVSASVSLNGDVLITDRDFTNAQGFAAPRWGNSLVVEAQQVVYAGGAIDAGIRLAELGREQAGVGEQLTREQQRFLALGQFLELSKLGNRMQVYDKNIELTRQLIADIQAKHEQGMALRNDVVRYELQMETLRLGLRKLQDMRSILNYQLCNQLGLSGELIVPSVESAVADLEVAADGPAGQAVAADAPSSTPQPTLASWQDAAVNSPLMQQAELQQRMAQQQLKLAKSELLPKVAVVAADNLSGPFTYDIPPLDKNLNYWYVGVGVKYPISSLFKQSKKVQQAAVQLRQSKAAHDVTAERVNNQMQQAWTEYQQSFVELHTQQKSVELACRNYQVVNDRYLSQLALITDMLDASNIKLNAELLEVDARINIIYAYYKLKFTAGTL